MSSTKLNVKDIGPITEDDLHGVAMIYVRLFRLTFEQI